MTYLDFRMEDRTNEIWNGDSKCNCYNYKQKFIAISKVIPPAHMVGIEGKSKVGNIATEPKTRSASIGLLNVSLSQFMLGITWKMIMILGKHYDHKSAMRIVVNHC